MKLAGLHAGCELRRVSGQRISSSVEQFELAIVKRRLVCAMLRKADLDKRQQQEESKKGSSSSRRRVSTSSSKHHAHDGIHDDDSDEQHQLYAQPLSAEEERLLGDAAVVGALSEAEVDTLTRELRLSGDGVATRGFCTVSQLSFDHRCIAMGMM